MALQDLTPQLRTRLNRMERAVGWFVFLATALLVFGLGYYLFKTAKRKGWFIPRAPYFTFTESATGLKVGDPVGLMGREIGQITLIETMDPWSPYNIYVEFEIKEPYNGYLWIGHQGSRAKITTADFLGKRVLEVTKGTDGYPAYRFHPLEEITPSQARTDKHPEHWLTATEFYDPTGTNVVLKALQPLTKENLALLVLINSKTISVLNTNETHNVPTVVWDDKVGAYVKYIPKADARAGVKANLYWLVADETPAITERLESIVGQVQQALPDFFRFTNQLATVLAHSTSLTSNLNTVALEAQPAISNLTYITAQLRAPGSLGDWALGPTGRLSAEAALGNANLAVLHADTNLTALMEKLAVSLDEVAGITSNLHAQVQANTNIVGSISKMIVDADEMVQGLKKHWLLRSAFKAPAGTNTVPAPRLPSPRDPSAR